MSGCKKCKKKEKEEYNESECTTTGSWDEVMIVESVLRDKIIALYELETPTADIIASELNEVADELERISLGKPTEARKNLLKRAAKTEFVSFRDTPWAEM